MPTLLQAWGGREWAVSDSSVWQSWPPRLGTPRLSTFTFLLYPPRFGGVGQVLEWQRCVQRLGEALELRWRWWCGGKCLSTCYTERNGSWLVAWAAFPGVNIPTGADFKLPA